MAFTVITYTPEPNSERIAHNFSDSDAFKVTESGVLRIAKADGSVHWLSPTAWYEVTDSDGDVLLSED